MARNPILFDGLVRSLTDPDLQAILPPAVGNFATFDDRLTYDPSNINGPPLDLTTGAVEDPRTPPDMGSVGSS